MNEKIPMKLKTIRKIPLEKDIKPIVETWAKQNGFRYLIDEEGTIDCYKSGWVTTAPVLVHIEKRETAFHLEAMIKADALSQLSNFFTAPPELTLESGPGIMEWERQVARNFVNKLFLMLELDPIA